MAVNSKLLGAVAIGAALLYVLPTRLILTAENDFLPLYVGGSLQGAADRYSPQVQDQKQIELKGGVLLNCRFQRPPFYGLLLKPLSWLPYYRAYLAFQALSLFCAIYFLRAFVSSSDDLVALAVMAPCLLICFILGQDVMLVVALLTLSILLARRGFDFAAGLVVSLCAIKFHLFALLPAAVLLQRRFRIFWGAVTGGSALALIGLNNGGLRVHRDWFALMQDTGNHPGPQIMTS